MVLRWWRRRRIRKGLEILTNANCYLFLELINLPWEAEKERVMDLMEARLTLGRAIKKLSEDLG